MPASASSTTPAAPSRFYFGMALTCALVAVVGFTPTYWAPMADGSLAAAPIVHLHALLFTAWSIFFIVQARLAETGRIARHRALGLADASIWCPFGLPGSGALSSMRPSALPLLFP